MIQIKLEIFTKTGVYTLSLNYQNYLMAIQIVSFKTGGKSVVVVDFLMHHSYCHFILIFQNKTRGIYNGGCIIKQVFIPKCTHKLHIFSIRQYISSFAFSICLKCSRTLNN
jgi:hypothetical protein